MTSTPTTRNRLAKQAAGDSTNAWGDVLNAQVFDLMDTALDGVFQVSVASNVTLTTANYVDDQARRRVIEILSTSTTSATLTLPALEKWYLVWNASSYDQVIATSGGGASVTVRAGEMVPIACDATNVARLTLLSMENKRLQNLATGTSANDAVNFSQMNAAINAASYSVGAFGVAITAGNAGQLLSNNGSIPVWTSALPSLAGVGGMTSAYPGLNRNGANLEAKLADGSAYTGFAAASLAWGATGRSLTDNALAADIWAATSATKANTPVALANSGAFAALTDASSVTWNAATQGYNASLALTANGHTINSPSMSPSPPDGWPAMLALTANNFTPTWSTGFDWGQAGAPAPTAGTGKIDLLSFIYLAATGKWRFLGISRGA